MLYATVTVKNNFNNMHTLFLMNTVSPHVVDLLFIVARMHQKINALFRLINFDYTTSFVKKIYSIVLQNLLSLFNYSDVFYQFYEL